MSRLLVLGDVHGAARAMKQVLERAKFSTSDRLIFLGDVCDGWSETPLAIDMLLDVVDVSIFGNHDEWFRDWVRDGVCVPEWWHQGGQATVQAYDSRVESPWSAVHASKSVQPSHKAYLDSMVDFYVEDEFAFTHGGFALNRPLGFPPPGGYNWDRWMWQDEAGKVTSPYYSRIFIGHTSTSGYSLEPVRRGEVWNLDQGAGWEGKLTLMDAHTEEYWQSDLVSDLYPEEKGRRG